MSDELNEFRKAEGLPELILKKRSCLKCQKIFESEWSGNRICPTCTEINEEVKQDTYIFDSSIDFQYDLTVQQMIDSIKETGSGVNFLEEGT